MKATITIEMDNAAFDGSPMTELSAILFLAAERTHRGEVLFSLKDTNGNTVGKLEVKP